MFKRTIVKSCPAVKASRAVMRVPADLVREWNGLLRAEKDCEWLALLTGERSHDGLLVEIDGMIIPRNQERSAGHVKLPEGPEPDRVVGVIHSHHHMGARFSSIDWKTLNNRFWSSIVISYDLDDVTDSERWWMGFDYEAVAQIKLPCGSLGMVEVEVEVVEGPEGTFSPKSILKASNLQHLVVDDLGDCPHERPVMVDDWRAKLEVKCGIRMEEDLAIQGALGETTARLSELPPAYQWVPATKGKEGKGWTTVDKRQAQQTPALTPMEEAEMEALAGLDFNAMTDAQLERWYELEDKMWGESRAAQQGEQWVVEDAAWEAYQRTYFDLQKEGENV